MVNEICVLWNYFQLEFLMLEVCSDGDRVGLYLGVCRSSQQCNALNFTLFTEGRTRVDAMASLIPKLNS